MAEHSEIKSLLKNIAHGLSRMSIKELNDAICCAMTTKDNEFERIETVIRLVAFDFGVSVRELKRPRARGLTDAKHICYCYLHKELRYSTRKIAKHFGNISQSNVYKGAQRLTLANTNIKVDRLFIEKYSQIKEKLNTKLNQ